MRHSTIHARRRTLATRDLAVRGPAALRARGMQRGPNSASKMTSFSSQASKSGDAAALHDSAGSDVAHAGRHGRSRRRSTRTLRLTGAVAYNAFKTTPVITQVGGPGEPHPGRARPARDARASRCWTSASPDYSQLLDAYTQGARRLSRSPTRTTTRAQDLYEHHAIAERDLVQAESDRKQAEADLNAAEQAHEDSGNQESGRSGEGAVRRPRFPCSRRSAAKWSSGSCSPGQVVQAGRRRLHDFRHEHRVGAGQRLPGRPRLRARRRRRGGADGCVSRTASTARFRTSRPALDPTTRTLQARIVVDNPGEKLKKDMYCTVDGDAPESIPNALAVPDAAVLRDDENQPFVYVANRQRTSSAGARWRSARARTAKRRF